MTSVPETVDVEWGRYCFWHTTDSNKFHAQYTKFTGTINHHDIVRWNKQVTLTMSIYMESPISYYHWLSKDHWILLVLSMYHKSYFILMHIRCSWLRQLNKCVLATRLLEDKSSRVVFIHVGIPVGIFVRSLLDKLVPITVSSSCLRNITKPLSDSSPLDLEVKSLFSKISQTQNCLAKRGHIVSTCNGHGSVRNWPTNIS